MATSGTSGGSTGKAPDAFRTIREVSEELDVPQHVLRFWESKFTQIKPLKRGGGRRYYRPEDIALLRRIRSLLYVEGYTIKGVQKLLRESGGKLSEGASSAPPAAVPARAAAASEPAKAASAPASSPASPPANLSPEQREQLSTLADELGELRDMLRGRV